jgi:hypothetical protein
MEALGTKPLQCWFWKLVSNFNFQPSRGVTGQEVIWIFHSCEHDFVLGFLLLFWVDVNFLYVDGGFYVIIVC